jgi:isopenicillin N synthase-like dioxygenase
MSPPSLPIIDFSLFRNPETRTATAKQIVEAAHSTGFLYLSHHGITEIDDIFSVSKQFFQQSDDYKYVDISLR